MKLLNAIQAENATGVPSAQLLLLALTGELPHEQDGETKLILFDQAVLGEWIGRKHTARGGRW